jgi:hypothetical protein
MALLSVSMDNEELCEEMAKDTIRRVVLLGMLECSTIVAPQLHQAALCLPAANARVCLEHKCCGDPSAGQFARKETFLLQFAVI